jgi:hypothetical protein
MHRRLALAARICALPLGVALLASRGVKISLVPCLSHPSLRVRAFAASAAVALAAVLAMLQLSWCCVLAMDPGRLDAEIRRRGAAALSGFPPCAKCGLPKPPRCHHCSRCGGCVLFMDHHCAALGTCLAFRNFKSFILVWLYGGAAAGLGSAVLLAAAFVDLAQRRAEQLALAAFCGLVSAALFVFARVYLTLKRHNLTTIEERFPLLARAPLPSAPVFERGARALLPLPARLDPFAVLGERQAEYSVESETSNSSPVPAASSIRSSDGLLKIGGFLKTSTVTTGEIA